MFLKALKGGGKEMKILNMIKYIGFWLVGFLGIKLVWFPFIRSVTTNDVYLLHAAVWPILIFTICWTIVFAIVLETH